MEKSNLSSDKNSRGVLLIGDVETALANSGTLGGPEHKLCREIQEAIDTPYDLGEYADMYILLLDAAYSAGITVTFLEAAAEHKFLINQQRTWGEPDENGVVEHV